MLTFGPPKVVKFRPNLDPPLEKLGQKSGSGKVEKFAKKWSKKCPKKCPPEFPPDPEFPLQTLELNGLGTYRGAPRYISPQCEVAAGV